MFVLTYTINTYTDICVPLRSCARVDLCWQSLEAHPVHTEPTESSGAVFAPLVNDLRHSRRVKKRTRRERDTLHSDCIVMCRLGTVKINRTILKKSRMP